MTGRRTAARSILVAATFLLPSYFATAQDPESFHADEADLSKATYQLKDGRNSVEAQMNWKTGGLVFSATRLSQNLYDEEGAKMAARDFAYAKAAEFLSGVLVGGGRSYEKRKIQLATGSDVSEKSAERVTQVMTVKVPESLVYGTIVDETFEIVPDPGRPNAKMGKATARIRLSLYGREQPERAIVPQMLEPVREAEKQAGFLVASFTPARAPAAPEAANEPKAVAPTTGLIVDAKGLRMPPVQYPALLVEGSEKQEVFGAINELSPEYLSKFGLAGWTRTVPEARDLKDRIGENPMVVKASRLYPQRAGAVLITGDLARQVLSADATAKFLSECRVVFVID